MNDGESLLKAILSQPDEDTPRLAFADWLDENGQPERAAYIRWMLRERFTHPFPRVSYRKWFAPWWTGATCRRHLFRDGAGMELLLMRVRDTDDNTVNRMHATRGFVGEIHLPCAAFMKHAESIFRAHPVTRVVLTDAAPAVYTGSLRTVYFWADGTHSEYEPYCVDPSIWLMLNRRDTVPAIADSSARDGWETAAEAHSHLSAACLAYGRKLAGLLTPAKAVA